MRHPHRGLRNEDIATYSGIIKYICETKNWGGSETVTTELLDMNGDKYMGTPCLSVVM